MKNNRRGFKKEMQRLVSMATIFALTTVCLPAGPIRALAAESNKEAESKGTALADKYQGFDGRKVTWKYSGSDDIPDYLDTIDMYANVKPAASTITVDLSKVRKADGTKSEIVDFEGRKAILSARNDEYIEFEINVPEDAMYSMEIDYFLSKVNSDHAKRAIFIDGEYPFNEAGDLEYYRYFVDDGEPLLNSIGDETRPRQKVVEGWRTQAMNDTTGISSRDFSLFLSKGKHTIMFAATKTDMYISEIRFQAPESIRSYAEVYAEYKAKGYKDVSVDKITFQAEKTAIEKNDTTLRRENDGDPLVTPASGDSRKLNVIGGSRWKYGNQSITWEFEVPEDGLYKIGVYEKQAWNDGLPSYRQIKIDGEVPFSELLEYKYEYTGSSKWLVKEFAAEDGEPYRFYLTKGKHTITMTVKLGDLAPILKSIEKDIALISNMLLYINMIAGSDPDPNYDYKFFDKIPTMKDDMAYVVDSLQEKYEMSKELSEKVPSMANNFISIQVDLKKMLEDPFTIARRVSLLEEAQKSLSEWYQSLQYLPLVLDEFYVGSPDEDWYKKPSNFFQRFAVTIKQFLLSFTKDYDSIGSVLSEDVVVTDTIDVWIARSTEYAEIIKELADESFTPETGIAINVNVLPSSQVDAGQVNAIMLSITAGKAPDVALGVDVKSPVEFAIREQVYDLSQMPGFEETKTNFLEAIFTPYEYQGGIYAIPETMNFNVMFYRKDLLSKYNIDLPDTWDDLYEYVLPALYQNGFGFYFGRDFTQFLYQNNGSFYTEDGLKSGLDSYEAYAAFKEYTELFTNYGIDKTANFLQHFRQGIKPMGVADFGLYMQLLAGAPELTGKWGIIPLLGHRREDGTVDRTAGGITQTGDIILKQSQKPEQSWKFLQWWTSTETQLQFAKEVESLIGAEARWNTANKNAFLSLSWDNEDIKTLEEQWTWVRETPYVLGGYMTDRHLTNAWTSVVMSGMDVREALERAVEDINRELRMKQEEYGIIAK